MTLAETLLCVALTSLVVGTMAAMYGFAAVRLTNAYSTAEVLDQANEVADELERTIRNAKDCEVITSGSSIALRCRMPEKGVDVNVDGRIDLYDPSLVELGIEVYLGGKYVWFYPAGTGATYKSGSGAIWRAEVTGTSDPTSSDLDRKFAYYFDSRRRVPLVTRVDLSVDRSRRLATFTVRGSAPAGAGATGTRSKTIQVTRSVHWRNWR
ncbi:MAG TPA: hypothetical protein VM328_09005 [Fimbriimonadaceae bacterium]|nr:hypothetical protein [Fimbriimonadaceae bacterium]